MFLVVIFLEFLSDFGISFYFFLLRELLRLLMFIILFFFRFVSLDILDLEERSSRCSIILDVVFFVVREMLGMFS